jgi:hypothetical protein
LIEGGNNVGAIVPTPDPRLVSFVEAIKSNPCRLSNTDPNGYNGSEAVGFASYYINTQVPLPNGAREHRYFVPLGPKDEDRNFIELACGEFLIYKDLFHTDFNQTEATARMECKTEGHDTKWFLRLGLKK